MNSSNPFTQPISYSGLLPETAKAVLSIDGLPLGKSAAVAYGDDLLAVFRVSSPANRPLPLDIRVIEALKEARRLVAEPIGEIRLALVDDGDDFQLMEVLAKALLVEEGINLQIVEPPRPSADQEIDHGTDLSEFRAREAALS